jgi:hypothetical protein
MHRRSITQPFQPSCLTTVHARLGVGEITWLELDTPAITHIYFLASRRAVRHGFPFAPHGNFTYADTSPTLFSLYRLGRIRKIDKSQTEENYSSEWVLSGRASHLSNDSLPKSSRLLYTSRPSVSMFPTLLSLSFFLVPAIFVSCYSPLSCSFANAAYHLIGSLSLPRFFTRPDPLSPRQTVIG